MFAFATSFNLPLTMETILTGLVALILFVYLFVAMIHPEKF